MTPFCFPFTFEEYLDRPKQLVKDLYDNCKWALQRAWRGYDSRATYDTHSHLAEHIPEVIKKLKAWGNSNPCFMPEDLEDQEHDYSTEQTKSFNKWHQILDQIIEGFEAGQKLIDGVSPYWDEVEDEWERRYPGKDKFVVTQMTEEDEHWDYVPEYANLFKELKYDESVKAWKQDNQQKFDRGMQLFHKYFFDLWD
jgi:hypothetical protein